MKFGQHLIFGMMLAGAIDIIIGTPTSIWTMLFVWWMAIFPDIDHVLWYWVNRRFTINPIEVNNWWLAKSRKTKWLIFHIPEFWIILFPI